LYDFFSLTFCKNWFRHCLPSKEFEASEFKAREEPIWDDFVESLPVTLLRITHNLQLSAHQILHRKHILSESGIFLQKWLESSSLTFFV
jgi:hypothetical protein